MRIYVDIDGTLTVSQHPRWAAPRVDMIEKVKKLIADGHQVVIWSGTSKYAQACCDKYDIKPDVATGKPNMIVDNQQPFRRARRMPSLTPDEFMEREIPAPEGRRRRRRAKG